MSDGYEGGLLNVADVRGCLSGLNAHHDNLRINAAEGIDDYLTLDGLNGVHDHGNSTRIEHLLRFLSLNISSGQPRSKTGMRVVPTDTHFVTANLFHHIHKLLLEDGIDRLD